MRGLDPNEPDPRLALDRASCALHLAIEAAAKGEMGETTLKRAASFMAFLEGAPPAVACATDAGNGKAQCSAAEAESNGVPFGQALDALKAGRRITRRGWNGLGMWLAFSPGSLDLPAEKFWAGPNREYAEQWGGCARVEASITMKTARGTIQMGWAPTVSDLLAEDWLVLGHR